jgi:hypothetical protein
MGGWMDGWMDGLMDGRSDTLTDPPTHILSNTWLVWLPRTAVQNLERILRDKYKLEQKQAEAKLNHTNADKRVKALMQVGRWVGGWVAVAAVVVVVVVVVMGLDEGANRLPACPPACLPACLPETCEGWDGTGWGW